MKEEMRRTKAMPVWPMLVYLLMGTTKCARHFEADMRRAEGEEMGEEEDAGQRKQGKMGKMSQYRSLKLK